MRELILCAARAEIPKREKASAADAARARPWRPLGHSRLPSAGLRRPSIRFTFNLSAAPLLVGTLRRAVSRHQRPNNRPYRPDRTGPDRTNGAAKVRCPGEGAPPMECSCHARASAQRPTDESIDRRRGTLARNSFRVDHVTNGSADAAPLFPAPLTGADRRGAARRVCSPLRALRSFSRCCVTRRPLRNDRHCRCCCATVRQPADAARR